mgnify:CR=1 FL=1
MKYNFKGYFNLGVIFLLIVLLLGVLGKTIFTEQNISYNKTNVYEETDNNIETEIEEKLEESSETSEQSYDKFAYITIDDGPSKYTNQILDILDKNDVKATFFMINRNMNTYKDEVKRIQQEGHGAGFHSVSHDVKTLYKTPQSTLEEFSICRNTFEEITGETSNLIRIPYGSKPNTPEESYKILVENGFLVWDWNLDTEDWKSTTDNIVSNVLLNGRNKDELVLLVHEKEQTVEALDGIIMILKERGYKILPITEEKEAMNFWNKNL